MYMLQHTYKCYIRFIITEPEGEAIINLRVGVLYIMNIFPEGQQTWGNSNGNSKDHVSS